MTKKRVSASKKNQDTQEFYSAAHTVAKNLQEKAQNPPSDQSPARNEYHGIRVDQRHQHTANSNLSSSSPSPADAGSGTTAETHTPPWQNIPATGHTPGSASKKKHRKLAVNFEVAKVSE